MGNFLADGFDKDAQGKGVAYAAGPFVYGVHGGGSYDNSVRDGRTSGDPGSL